MMRLLASFAVLCVFAAPAAAAHGGGHGGGGYHGGGGHGGYHGGYHGWGHHSHGHVFIGGSVFFDPFWYGYPYYYYPYPYYPYYYPDYPDYPPPPDEEAGAGTPGEPGAGTPGEPGGETAEATPSPRIATYGLVQLRGVPDGAAVDLDGRFWLTADALDDRWLALPEGRHTITIRARNAGPLERTVDVKPGGSTVVRFPAPRRD